ncbi:hypothetical protein L1987_85240 [Smallanthus sonchifolius]|uniref:Uncharacterized protein n=1 Tax=Smallanthus sonchifolius TaxID=185202 RepID=A0ACB8XWN8_9ASTR|nr:hypothetical protein L1987_85240 [Smallanthus sonchifolius]
MGWGRWGRQAVATWSGVAGWRRSALAAWWGVRVGVVDGGGWGGGRQQDVAMWWGVAWCGGGWQRMRVAGGADKLPSSSWNPNPFRHHPHRTENKSALGGVDR